MFLDVALDGLEVESGFCSIGALTFTVDARINYSTILDIWMTIFLHLFTIIPLPTYIHTSFNKKNPTTQPIHPLHLLLSRNSTNPPLHHFPTNIAKSKTGNDTCRVRTCASEENRCLKDLPPTGWRKSFKSIALTTRPKCH